MKQLLIFAILTFSLFGCKWVEEKSFGPLKQESLNYYSLLIDSFKAHNPETVKLIEFDTTTMMVKVIYDEDLGDVAELEGYITKLDLIAPIVVDTVGDSAKAIELKEAKIDTTLKDFISKKIIPNADSMELRRLDSLKEVKLMMDSIAKIDTLSVDSIRSDSVL